MTVNWELPVPRPGLPPGKHTARVMAIKEPTDASGRRAAAAATVLERPGQPTAQNADGSQRGCTAGASATLGGCKSADVASAAIGGTERTAAGLDDFTCASQYLRTRRIR